jgi:uncharacterized membrane protein YcgQ (UPF0703/DUF1980 family)
VFLEDQSFLAEDAWVKVTGPLQVRDFDKNWSIVILADAVQPVDEPYDIYLNAF